MLGRALGSLFALIFTLLLFAGAGTLYLQQAMDQPGPLAEVKTIVIPRGSSVIAIGGQLEEQGVIASRHFFRLRYYLAGKPELIAGEYGFTPGARLKDVLNQIAEGRVVRRVFDVREPLPDRVVGLAGARRGDGRPREKDRGEHRAKSRPPHGVIVSRSRGDRGRGPLERARVRGGTSGGVRAAPIAPIRARCLPTRSFRPPSRGPGRTG